MVQCWRNAADVLRFARAQYQAHRPAWQAFYARARRTPGAVGIWHELYDVVAGASHATYVDMPSLGLDLVLRMDGLSWMFALVITVVGALVCLYARYYMSPEDPVARFYAFFLAFMGAMLGVVLSGNLIQLVIFWELTSFVSFLLIGYWHHRTDAQRGAWLARYAERRNLAATSAVLLRRAIEHKSAWIARHDRSLRAKQPTRNVSIPGRAG